MTLKQLQENYSKITALHQISEKFEAINHVNIELQTENNLHQKQIKKINLE